MLVTKQPYRIVTKIIPMVNSEISFSEKRKTNLYIKQLLALNIESY